MCVLSLPQFWALDNFWGNLRYSLHSQEIVSKPGRTWEKTNGLNNQLVHNLLVDKNNQR